MDIVTDNQIIDMYKQLQSGRIVAEKLNIDRRRIYKVLKENNIIPASSKKYSFTSNYFEKIDTEQKAYWLGFIMADGNIDKREVVLCIQIQIKDIELLREFAECLSYSGPIKEKSTYDKRTNKIYECARIRICSKQMIIDLQQYGITPQKTGNEIVPKIDKKLIRHFIRGYFDGDGNICTTTKHAAAFSICGYKETLEKIADYLPVSCALYLNKKDFGSLSVTQMKRIKTLYKYLYKDATVYLQRKKSIFEERIRPL